MPDSQEVAIAGVGESAVGIVAGKGSLALCADAVSAALADAGIERDEVDGLITTDSYVQYHNRHAVQLAQYLGLPSTCGYIDTMTSGSSIAGGQGVEVAAALIRSGTCRCVVVACGDNLRSAENRDHAVATMANNYEREFEVPHGPVVATRYGFVARRFMAERGITREQLSAVPVSARRWSSRNPAAQMRKEISIEDVVASKPISSPLHLLDCSLISDGAGAVVVTSRKRAEDGRHGAVRVLGAASSYGAVDGHVHDSVTQQGSFVSYGCQQSGGKAMGIAGVTPEDIDLLYLYDCFSINILVMLEDLGFCERGASGDFVASGATAPGGRLPVNTHGGLLSYCHPGKPGGIFMFVEAVRQLRGQATGHQVDDARTAFVQGHGGHAAISVSTVLAA